MRILLATDGSPGAGSAIDLVTRLPRFESGVDVLHVVECAPPFSDEIEVDPEEREAFTMIEKSLREEAEAYLDDASARLERAGGQVRRQVRVGAPAAEILAAAEDADADLIVLGSKGQHGDSNGRLGRTVRRVLKNSTRAVLIARDCAERSRALHVLFPFDGSAGASVAKRAIRRLAPAGERVTLLSVLTVATTLYRFDLAERMSSAWRAHRDRVTSELDALAAELRTDDLEVDVRVLDGGTDAADEVLGAVRLLRPDITVVGHSGKGSLQRLVLGSVSEALAEQAPCSVWIAEPSE